MRLFAVDCQAEVDKIARSAPGSRVFCRILSDCAGAEWPLSRKFGCEPVMAVDVLEHALVYLDIGKFGGLAETMDEAIRYPITTQRDGDRMEPCVLAGPTCDSADVLYEKKPYPLPITLTVGDEVLIENTGAYTTTYSAVAFNGFEPLKAYVI